MSVQHAPARSTTAPERRPLTALCLGWFIVIVDATIVNVALPSMAGDLRASVSGLQWVLDGYTVTFASLLLAGGSAADRWGARRVFEIGLAVFAAASIGCALAPDLAALITARVVQGVGAALLVPACLALIQATYPDRLTRARAIGIWGTVGGVAGGSGPLLGGILTDAFGWRALFWVNVPIAVLTLWLTRRYVRAGDVPAGDGVRRGFDLPGQLTGGIALVGVSAGVVEGGRNGWLTPVPIALIALGIAAAATFVVIERCRAEPMLPLSIFDSRDMIGATAVGFIMNFSFYGLLFVEAIVLERRYAFSPLLTGLALLPQTGVIAVGSWFGGVTTGRIGPRVPMMVGMAVGAAGFFGLTVIGPETPYVAIVAPMAAAGFGISFCMPAATSAVVEAAPQQRAGIASGVLNASRQVGGALGIALLGSFIAAAHGLGATLSGARMAMVVAGAAYVIGLVLAASMARAPDPSVGGPPSNESRLDGPKASVRGT